jgi:hypothetical protein
MALYNNRTIKMTGSDLTPPQPHIKSPPGLLNCQAFKIFGGGFYLGEATIRNFIQKFAKK